MPAPFKMHLKATRVALLLSKFHRTIKHRITIALKPFEMSSVEWIILGYLDHRKEPVIISEIAETLGIQPSFMTVLVAKLLKRGFILTGDDAIDRRKRRISLAPGGRKVVQLMQRQFEEFFAPYFSGLSGKEIETYIKVMTTIIDNAGDPN